MGAGVAKCIREKYPDIMTDYVRWCQNYDENYLLGLIQLYRINENEDKFIANCFAQGWYSKWMSNGWRTSDKQDVKNQDL